MEEDDLVESVWAQSKEAFKKKKIVKQVRFNNNLFIYQIFIGKQT